MYCRFRIILLDAALTLDVTPPSGWTHVVMNYLGPEDEQGIRVYFNGTQVRSDNTKQPATYQPGGDRVVVGRFYVNYDDSYGNVDMDELLFFNEALTDENIRDMN